jgi:hypothetical protein
MVLNEDCNDLNAENNNEGNKEILWTAQQIK